MAPTNKTTSPGRIKIQGGTMVTEEERERLRRVRLAADLEAVSDLTKPPAAPDQLEKSANIQLRVVGSSHAIVRNVYEPILRTVSPVLNALMDSHMINNTLEITADYKEESIDSLLLWTRSERFTFSYGQGGQADILESFLNLWHLAHDLQITNLCHAAILEAMAIGRLRNTELRNGPLRDGLYLKGRYELLHRVCEKVRSGHSLRRFLVATWVYALQRATTRTLATEVTKVDRTFWVDVTMAQGPARRSAEFDRPFHRLALLKYTRVPRVFDLEMDNSFNNSAGQGFDGDESE